MPANGSCTQRAFGAWSSASASASGSRGSSQTTPSASPSGTTYPPPSFTASIIQSGALVGSDGYSRCVRR